MKQINYKILVKLKLKENKMIKYLLLMINQNKKICKIKIQQIQIPLIKRKNILMKPK